LTGSSVSPILTSSLEVMVHAIEHLKNGTDKDLKFAVQHADNAVELILKELARFKRIRLIDKKGRSISYYDCIDRLEKKGVGIQELTDIDLLHTERNSTYHLGSQPDKRKTDWLVYDVGLNLIKRICKEEFGYDITRFSKLFTIPSKVGQEIKSTRSEMVNMYMFETLSSLDSNVYNATVVSAFSGIEALLKETLSLEIRSQADFMKRLLSQKVFSEKLTKDIQKLQRIRNRTIHGLTKATREHATFALDIFRRAIDEIGLPLELKCKTCGVQFKSEIAVSRKAFETSVLERIKHKCPNGHVHSYNKEDYIVRL